MPKTRVGFVGCGGISEAHLRGLVKHPDVALVGFCDINESRLETVQKNYGSEESRTFTSARAMFASVELDAAYFCLPPFAHGEELIAVEKGVPFLVEKPAHLDLGQAREIAAAVREKALIAGVAYMNRYRRSVQRVREILQNDPAILTFGGWIGGTPRAAPGGIGSWWVDKSRSGGQFHEQVTHTVDLVLWFCGTPVEVHAYAAQGLNPGVPSNYSIEDAMVVSLRFPNNAIANLWSSCSSNGGGGGVALNVYANNTTALFTGWECSVRILTDGGKQVEEIKGEGDIFAIEDDHFIRAVRSGDASLVKTPYAEGVEAIRVSLAATESYRSGRPVVLG
jgi:predicted dehydrogenase